MSLIFPKQDKMETGQSRRNVEISALGKTAAQPRIPVRNQKHFTLSHSLPKSTVLSQCEENGNLLQVGSGGEEGEERGFRFELEKLLFFQLVAKIVWGPHSLLPPPPEIWDWVSFVGYVQNDGIQGDCQGLRSHPRTG